MMDALTYRRKSTNGDWQDDYSCACFASEAVIHLIDKNGFSSAEVRELFQIRGGFMSRLHQDKEDPSIDDSRLLGAVLSKLAQRGKPAPCSLMVEHHILKKAQDAGLLIFEESIECGRIKFSCMPLMKDLDLMLKICCLPELLIEDSEIDPILQDYEGLMEETGTRRQFYKKLISALPDRRLALFVVPGESLGQDLGNGTSKFEDRVDFFIQIPNLKRKKILRIAIQLEESSDYFEKDDGWTVKRFGRILPQYWESEIRKLADQISHSIPEDILTAARQLREMPLEKKSPIQDLISLPIAEAQLTQAIACLIHMGEKKEIIIGNPQKLDLAVVAEAVRETICALSSLYGIPCSIKLNLADDSVEPDLRYYSIPTGADVPFSCIISRPICSIRGPIKLDAIPRSINRGDLKVNIRKSLKSVLNNIFRIQEFKEDQIELIEQMLSLQGSIGLLKPGGGKTLAYQFASILQPGNTLVIVPSWHMAINQEFDLIEAGIHNSKVIFKLENDREQNTWDSKDWHESSILILAVDALQGPDWRTRLNDIFSNRISFLVFDEIQALSEWSNGFRPEYLNAVRWARDNCAIRGSKPSSIALTSSGSRLLLLDIIKELELDDLDCIIESTSYDRENLQYEIYSVNAKKRMPVLISALKAALRENAGLEKNLRVPVACGLVICAHEDDEEMGLISISKSLTSYLDMPVGVCSLKPPKKFLRLGGLKEEWLRASCKALLQFKRNELPILVCSTDIAIELSKKDIRFTLHADLPASLDEFYRQSSRAGYDDVKSSCIILSSDDCNSSEIEDISDKWNSGIRNSVPLAEEFPGKAMEKRILGWVVSKLRSSSPGHAIGEKVDTEIFISSLPFFTKDGLKLSSEFKQRLLEKALYRLLILGAIESYALKTGSFGVTAIITDPAYIYKNYKKYISRYETERLTALYIPKENSSLYPNSILKCGCRLIDYAYHEIRARKKSDSARMHNALEEGQKSLQNFLDCMHDLVEKSEIEGKLTQLDLESPWRVLDDIKGLENLLGLYLACQKKIKSQLCTPVYRMISGFCVSAIFNKWQMNGDFPEGFGSFRDSTAEASRADMCRLIFTYAELLMPSQKEAILKSIWQTDPSLEISRLCYEKSESSNEVSYSSIFELVDGILGTLEAEGVLQ